MVDAKVPRPKQWRRTTWYATTYNYPQDRIT